MNCIALPVTFFTRCYTGSRLGYRHLSEDHGGLESSGESVTVVVGKEKREFKVEKPLLCEGVGGGHFWVLIDILKKEKIGRVIIDGAKRRILVDNVDVILFEHMMWLIENDYSALFELNLREIVDFYAEEN